MRKCLSIFLVLLLLLSGCAGSQNSSESVYFYYYNVAALNDQSENVIFAHPVDTDIGKKPLRSIILKYLEGPDSESRDIPFTQGTTVVDIDEQSDLLFITLSNDCSSMQQLELTLAGSCLARTLFQFTQAQSITIQSEDGFSYIENELIFTRNNIIVADDLVPAG